MKQFKSTVAEQICVEKFTLGSIINPTRNRNDIYNLISCEIITTYRRKK